MTWLEIAGVFGLGTLFGVIIMLAIVKMALARRNNSDGGNR